jgi:hypothetical protein
MDIEGSEWSVFIQMDMDYACKYFKQILFETHPQKRGSMSIIQTLELLHKLDKFFLLFRRDTRMYADYTETELGKLTEFQRDVPIVVRNYGKDGTEVAAWLFSIGEFYFVNKNFL